MLKLLEQRVLASVVHALPRTLTPNHITLVGQVASLAAFLIAVISTPVRAPGLFSMAAAVLIYVLADSVDGMFARHTQQTSRLGEMLDHWLDALSVPLLVFAFAFVLRAPPALTLASVIAVGILHYTTVLHGFRIGHVHLGVIGMIEGMCVGVACCIVAGIFGPELFLRSVVGGISIGSLVLSTFVFGGCLAFGSMRKVFSRFADFTAILVLVAAIAAWFAWGRASLLSLGLLAIATTSLYEGRVLRARLLRLPLNLNAGLAGGLIVGGAVGSIGLQLSAEAQTCFAGIAALGAFGTMAADFTRTVRALTAPPRSVE